MKSAGILVRECGAKGELAVENFEEVHLERDLTRVFYLVPAFR